MPEPPVLSVVVPVFNERDSIRPLTEEVLAVQDRLPPLELIFADDGSTDETWAVIREVSGSHPAVRGVRTPVNRGQSAAMHMGLQAARGEILALMDGDLQNNPADLPELVAGLKDADVVCGYRAHREDTWSRRVASRIANRVRRWVTRDTLRDTGCSLKVFRRECVADLPPLQGMHRFMAAYFQLHDRTIREFPVDHRPRPFGASKYTNLQRLPRTLFDLVGFTWYRSRYRPPLGRSSIERTEE